MNEKKDEAKNRGRSVLPGLSGTARKSGASFLADDLELELKAARQQGVFGILRMRYEAWIDERLKGAYQRKMGARQALVAAKTKTVRMEQELADAVHDGTKQDARQIIEATQLEHLRVRSEEIYSPQVISHIIPQLASNSELNVTPGEVPQGSLGVPMTNHISDSEINQEALKLLMKLTSEGLKEEDRRDLEQRYPRLIAEEIQRRATDLAKSALRTDRQE